MFRHLDKPAMLTNAFLVRIRLLLSIFTAHNISFRLIHFFLLPNMLSKSPLHQVAFYIVLSAQSMRIAKLFQSNKCFKHVY